MHENVKKLGGNNLQEDLAVSIENLTKNYGQFTAIEDVNLEVKPNEIFALIGPNGAGKTTTLRIIATLLTLNGGTAKVYGLDIREEAEQIREFISYLPEEAGAYKNLTGRAYLRFMAELMTGDHHKLDEYIERGMEISGLGDKLKEKIGSYSKGMTRKLLLGRALMTQPRLAILDEPTSGLDVINALEVRNLIRSYAQEGMTVFLSSHNMLEIEYLSDRVGIIHQGKIREIGSPQELKEKYKANNLEEVFAEVAQ